MSGKSTRQAIEADLLVNTGTRGLMALCRAAIFSPGFSLALRYRVAHHLDAKGSMLARLLKRVIWLSAVSKFGCYISPSARIGPGVFFPHPVGIVIGERARVGAHATIYQNVTLGRLRESDVRYPSVGDGVTLYAGALVIGPITLGDGVVVGGNSVVMQSVPDRQIAVGSPARLRSR